MNILEGFAKADFKRKDLPVWIRRLNYIALSPILLWPLVFYGTIFLSPYICIMKMRKLFPYILLILSLTYSQSVMGQEKPLINSDNGIKVERDSINENRKLGWATAGIGAYGPAIDVVLKLTYSWGNDNISAKYVAASSFSLGSDGGGDDSFKEIGLFFGKQKFTRTTIGRVAAGISYVPEAKINQKTWKGLGLGGEAEVMLKSEAVGIGLMLSVLIVPSHLWTFGLGLNINFGKLDDWSLYGGNE